MNESYPLCAYCEDATATIFTTVNDQSVALCLDCRHDHIVACDRCEKLMWPGLHRKRLGQTLCDACYLDLESPRNDRESCPF